MEDVLEVITRLRLARKWSEYELAKNTGIPQSTISTWYRKGQVPTLPSIEKICAGFGITLSQFFAQGEEPVSPTPSQRELLRRWAALTGAQQEIFLELFRNIP